MSVLTPIRPDPLQPSLAAPPAPGRRGQTPSRPGPPTFLQSEKGSATPLPPPSERPLDARIAPTGATAKAITRLPVSALRIEADTAAALARVGLKTVGCLAALPRGPLASRFGAKLLRRLDQALGQAEEAMEPLRPAPQLSAERAFAEPIGHQDDVARAIALLAEALEPLLEARAQGARRLILQLFRVDGHVARLAVATARPTRHPSGIAALFAERLAGLRDELDAGFGFDLIKLDVAEADAFDETLGDMISGKGGEDGLIALIDRLGARLGPERIRGFQGAETHIPERSFGTLPMSRLRPGMPATGPGARLAAPPLTRPLLLLPHPEPVAALAAVPDGPPVRFRWRKAAYAVTRVEGPERIACEWWRDGRGALTRDYFRVETEGGQRLWLFRNGLYGRETDRTRWHVHGIFA